MTIFRRKYPRWLLALFGLLTLLSLAACSGSGNNAATPPAESGDLAVSLTDAAGDFAAYTVDVVALTLTRGDGAVVSALPRTARLDFSQYVEMSELLTVATVPAGTYVAATMTLDYSNADIRVENGAGELVTVNNIVDATGNPLTRAEVSVRLDARNRLVIAPAVPMHLLLDFDLKATNTVTFDGQGLPTLSVEPYLVADLNREDGGKTHRLRGLLASVDPAGNNFTMLLRPFFAALSGADNRFGLATVSSDSDTLYEVNGETFQGVAGLTAMQNLEPDCAVVVLGNLRFAPLRFAATQVYADSHLLPGDRDSASGSVVARQGNTLRIKGATLSRSDGSITFNARLTVTIAESTRVRRQFSPEALGIGDISVGQQLTVFGSLDRSDPENPLLDAGAGKVRLEMTTVRGTVVTVDPADPTAQLTLALQSIEQRRAGDFDFSGTGGEGAGDADPHNYQIQTGALNLAGVAPRDPLLVRGFVQPFGAAPQDFNARTIINAAEGKALLKVQWQPATGGAFTSIAATGLTLNLSDPGPVHHLFRGRVVTDLGNLGAAPLLAPRQDGKGLFILRREAESRFFATYVEFSAALTTELAMGGAVRTVWARGDFTDATATLSADLIEIKVVSPALPAS